MVLFGSHKPYDGPGIIPWEIPSPEVAESTPKLSAVWCKWSFASVVIVVLVRIHKSATRLLTLSVLVFDNWQATKHPSDVSTLRTWVGGCCTITTIQGLFSSFYIFAKFYCSKGILPIWSTKWSLFAKLFAWMGCKSRDESNDAKQCACLYSCTWQSEGLSVLGCVSIRVRSFTGV
jgi:hypothetical protein